jgi:uncharacterized protein (TIGR02246 family)
MRHSRVFLSLLLLLWLTLANSAWAEPKEEVAAATAKWAAVFVDDNPDSILALYAPDAVLWGTLSPTLRQGPAALREYFVAAFKALPGHKVSFGDQLIRVYGDTAVNTGYYTFSYVKDGETKTLPARYSFVYAKGDKGWLIVDHHSSSVPVPLR